MYFLGFGKTSTHIMIRTLALLFFSLIFSFTLLAQDISSIDFKNLKADDLSDQQIQQIYERAQSQGLSIQEVEAMAMARGMSSVEVAKLRSRFTGLQSGINAPSTELNLSEDRLRDTDDDTLIKRDSTDLSNPNSNKIFGSDLFNNSRLTFEPSQNIPTPKNYVLGAGDENGHSPLVALVLRGDHTMNEIKVEKHPLILSPLTMAPEQRIIDELGTTPGSIGPVGLPIAVIADRAVTVMGDFTAGANEAGFHHINLNWERDCSYRDVADLRNVVAGDPSPCGQGEIEIKRGIEVGHIFQLGDKYSKAMDSTVLNENGKAQLMQMGCYGIGITRVVAACIEQNFDDNGIIWPLALAPFEVALIPLNYEKSETVKEATDQLYAQLKAAGIDVIMDDRAMRPGVKFADAELIGLPHRVVIGDRGLDSGMLEYRDRSKDANEDMPLEGALEFIKNKLGR